MRTPLTVLNGSQPVATSRFQWVMGVAALLLSLGGVLDNWAHFHGRVDQSFFTPWHAVMYGMMALFGIVLGTLALCNVCKGYRWTRSLPTGYMLSLAGVFFFIIAGFLDLGWHAFFGIEQATAAFVSPTHILLCAAGLLTGTGPLRAAWLTLVPAAARGWRLLGPMLCSATATLIALGIFTQFASPMNDTFAAKSAVDPGTLLINTQSFGVAEMIVQTVVLMSMVLLLLRTWTLPFGAITVLIGFPSIAQLMMRDNYWLIASVITTGLVTDCVLLSLRPPITGTRLYFAAAFLPAVYQALMFLVLGLTAGLSWPADLIAGSVLYASATGLFLSFLLDWPVKRQSQDARQEATIAPPSSATPHQPTYASELK